MKINNIIKAAALALGIAGSPQSAEYTLNNVKQYLGVEEVNGKLISDPPIVNDYSELKSIVEKSYFDVAGESLDVKIQILTPRQFADSANKYVILPNAPQYCAFTTYGKVFVKRTDLISTLNTIGHELGHRFKNRFQEIAGTDYKERVVDEATAMIFNEVWNNYLVQYLGVKMIALSTKKEHLEMPHVSAAKLAQKLLDKEKDERKSHQRLLKDPIKDLIRIIQDCEEYRLYEKLQNEDEQGAVNFQPSDSIGRVQNTNNSK